MAFTCHHHQALNRFVASHSEEVIPEAVPKGLSGRLGMMAPLVYITAILFRVSDTSTPAFE
jgi:hypothetical protein